MQLLRDNLTLWTSSETNEAEEAPKEEAKKEEAPAAEAAPAAEPKAE